MRRTKLGLSRVVAIAVVTAVTVTVMSFYALWIAGVSTESGQGTRPIKLGLYNPFVIGDLVEVMIKNLGGDTVYISDVTINDLECMPRLAFDSNNPDEYLEVYKVGDTLSTKPVAVKPGESVTFIFKSPIYLKPGVTYEVRVMTTSGYTYITYLDVARIGNWRNYNFTYVFFKCLEPGGPSPTKVNGVTLHYCAKGAGSVCKNVEANKDLISQGYSGYLVIFDISTWTYEYHGVYNKDVDNCDVTNVDNYLLLGTSNKGTLVGGSLTNPPPTQTVGSAEVIVGKSAINASDYVFMKSSNYITLKSPILVYVNLKSSESTEFTIKQLNGNTYVFKLPPVGNAIPGFDFLVLLQPGAFATPSYTWPSWGSPPDLWVDYVMRITWLKDGSVHVWVYRSVSNYLNVFLIGLNYVYYKPACINLSTSSTYVSCSSNYFVLGPNGEKIYYPIGYDGGNCVVTLNGYVFKEWVVQG